MPFVNVCKDEAKTVSADDPVNSLGTFSLNEDIAVTFYNPATRKAGMARTINYDDLLAVVNELTDGANIIEVRLVGGDGSEAAKTLLEEIFKDLELIDNGRKILNIVSANLNEIPHPHSFRISAVDGTLSYM